MSPTRPPRWCCLLRAVNVGGKNKIPMAALRDSLKEAGYDEVATLLQSGNVVLRSDHSAPEVEAAVSRVIEDAFGLAVSCVALGASDLVAMGQANALAQLNRDPSRLVTIVLSEEPSATGRAPLPSSLGDDVLHRGRFVFQWCPEGISNAMALTPWLEKQWSLTATARNWRTMTKLSSMVLEGT